MSDLITEGVQADPPIASQPNEGSVGNSEEVSVPPVEAGETKARAEDGASNGTEPTGSGGEKIETDEKIEQDETAKPLTPSNREWKSKEAASKYNRNRERRSKFDPSVLPITNDSTAIRTQVEFYFSDSNLPTDKHMTYLAGISGTNPVKITEIHKFGRMQRFQPYSAVVAALRESQLLVVSGAEGLETVERKTPFDPNQKDEAREARTIYAKGFGDELPTTQFDIEAFFAPYGPTNAVRLRRTDDKAFKGSCFIEFQDGQIAQKFLDLDPKPLWQGKVSLDIMSKREYVGKKNEQLRSGEISPNRTRLYNYYQKRGGNRGGNRGGRDRQDSDNRDPDDWKKRREEDQKSGFREYNRDQKHRGHRGRGSRGRGRGNRGSRDSEADHRQGDEKDSGNQNEKSPADSTKPTEEEPSKKRARENDAEGGEVLAKKVDTKEHTGAGAS